MRGHSLHGNREIPRTPAPDGGAGRPGEAVSGTPGTPGHPNERFYAKHPNQEPYAIILPVRICAAGPG